MVKDASKHSREIILNSCIEPIPAVLANPVGRPSRYKPDLCEQVTQWFRDGDSKCEVAYKLNIDEQTLYDWSKKYPEFAQAVKKGTNASKGWWMNIAKDNLMNRNFNAVLWYMNMKNRFGWTDKHENVITATISHEDALKELE